MVDWSRLETGNILQTLPLDAEKCWWQKEPDRHAHWNRSVVPTLSRRLLMSENVGPTQTNGPFDIDFRCILWAYTVLISFAKEEGLQIKKAFLSKRCLAFAFLEVQCDHPESTKDGFIEVSNFKGSYVYGSRATYHCNPGFILWGKFIRSSFVTLWKACH